MPFYDYKCSECGKTFEVKHGMGEKPEKLTCEFCHSKNIQRIFQAVRWLGTGQAEAHSHHHSGGGSCGSCSSSACGSCH